MSDTDTVIDTEQDKDLDYFLNRWNRKLKKDALVVDWHVGLYRAYGVELPYTANVDHVYCTQEDRIDGKYVLNVEKTRILIAKVVKYATSLGYNVVKPMKEEDEEFHTIVTISNDPEIKITYIASRTVVCTPIKEKVYVPAEIVPAKFEEKTVGYDCEKISFLAYNTDDIEL